MKNGSEYYTAFDGIKSNSSVDMETWNKATGFVVNPAINENNGQNVERISGKFRIEKSVVRQKYKESVVSVINDLIDACDKLNKKIATYYTGQRGPESRRSLIVELFNFRTMITELSTDQMGFDIDNINEKHKKAVAIAEVCLSNNSTIKNLITLEANLSNPNRHSKVVKKEPISIFDFTEKGKIFSLYDLVADQLMGFNARYNYAYLGLGQKENINKLNKAEKCISAFVESCKSKKKIDTYSMIDFLDLLEINEPPLGFSPYIESNNTDLITVLDCVNAIHYDKDKADKMAANAKELEARIHDAQQRGESPRLKPVDIICGLLLQAAGYDINETFKTEILKYQQYKESLKQNETIEEIIVPNAPTEEPKPQIEEKEQDSDKDSKSEQPSIVSESITSEVEVQPAQNQIIDSNNKDSMQQNNLATNLNSLTRFLVFPSTSWQGFWSGRADKYPVTTFNTAVAEALSPSVDGYQNDENYKHKAWMVAEKYYSPAVQELQDRIKQAKREADANTLKDKLKEINEKYEQYNIGQFAPHVTEEEKPTEETIIPIEESPIEINQESLTAIEEKKENASELPERITYANIKKLLVSRNSKVPNSNFCYNLDNAHTWSGYNRITMIELTLFKRVIEIASKYSMDKKDEYFNAYKDIVTKLYELKCEGKKLRTTAEGYDLIKKALDTHLVNYTDEFIEKSMQPDSKEHQSYKNFKILYYAMCDYLLERFNQVDKFTLAAARNGEADPRYQVIGQRKRDENNDETSDENDDEISKASQGWCITHDDYKGQTDEPVTSETSEAEKKDEATKDTETESSTPSESEPAEKESSTPSESEPAGKDDTQTTEAAKIDNDEPITENEPIAETLDNEPIKENDNNEEKEESDMQTAENNIKENDMQTSDYDVLIKIAKKTKPAKLNKQQCLVFDKLIKIYTNREQEIENKEAYEAIIKNKTRHAELTNGRPAAGHESYVAVLNNLENFRDTTVKLTPEITNLFDAYVDLFNKVYEKTQKASKQDNSSQVQEAEVTTITDEPTVVDEDTSSAVESKPTKAENEEQNEIVEQNETKDEPTMEEESKPVSIWQLSFAAINYIAEFYNLKKFKKFELGNFALSVVDGISFDYKVIETEKRKVTDKTPTKISKNELLAESTTIEEETSDFVKQIVSNLDDVNDLVNYKNVSALAADTVRYSEGKLECENLRAIYKNGRTISIQ